MKNTSQQGRIIQLGYFNLRKFEHSHSPDPYIMWLRPTNGVARKMITNVLIQPPIIYYNHKCVKHSLITHGWLDVNPLHT